MNNEVSRIPSRGNDKSMPPNYMKCKKTIQVAMTQRSPGVGSEQVQELLEGFQFSDKLIMLMTPSRTDPTLLQSIPEHLQMQREEQEDLAPRGLPNPAGTKIQDPFPEWRPCVGSGGSTRGSRARTGCALGLGRPGELRARLPDPAVCSRHEPEQRTDHETRGVLSPDHRGAPLWGSSPALGTISETCSP